ncbi:PEP-CTERM sorting domain-containing protein [Roseateles sp.]|uniref:PEP-CTERM sorting domain-containing protein n=1 Tax=Roseateles sp. TaxID=1971397 RepID=UPI002E024A2B|nr:PEP-CTERM sorting domain-containing protein [Roseateles sp.]HEV6968185.1 PEP-CTERM sorting domain-containing protein [Roseateles sp.]
MMKLSRLFTAAATVLAMGSALASPIALQPGPVYVQFNNMEQAGLIDTSGFANTYLGKLDGADRSLTTGSNEFNWGVFNVSSVQAGGVATDHTDISGGTTYFADGLSGGQIHGIFYGFQLNCANPVGCTKLTGGYIDLYWTDGNGLITNSDLNGNYSFANRTGFNQMGKFTQGTLLARLGYQAGAITGDTTTTVTSSVDPLNFSGVGLADGFASVMDVNGDGVIDAADGAWASVLDSNWFYTDPTGTGAIAQRDLRFSTFYQNMDKWDNGPFVQGLRSNDPARAFALPEPGSVTLVGLALLGLGAARRRRQG